MKKKFRILSVVLALSFAVPAYAQNANVEATQMLNIWEPTNLQSVNLHLEKARTSDQLVALAKASEFNIFADASQFPSTSAPLSMDYEQTLLEWILETASQEHLTWRRSRERTLLFWKEPDVTSTVKALILENAELSLAANTEATPQSPALSPFENLPSQKAELFLADYLQAQHGWDGQSPLQLEFKLSELPPEAATELLRIARSNLARYEKNNRTSWTADASWLSNQSWQNARLTYSQPPGRPDKLLVVRIINGNTQKFMPLDGLFVAPLPPVYTPEVATISMEKQASPSLSALELATDAALKPAISLEVKEMPLRDFLSEIRKQSNVQIEILPNLGKEQRITARASELPIYQVMSALSELYGTGWAKTTEGAYQMQPRLSPVRVAALRIGDTGWFNYWRSPRRNIAPPRLIPDRLVDWQSEFVNAGFDGTGLQTPEGVAVSSLPVELQSLIRRAVEQHYAVDLMRRYNGAFASSDVLAPERADEVMVSVSPAFQQPAPVPARKTLRPPINTSPVLKVTLVDNGQEAYSYYVYGPQMREITAKRVAKQNEIEQIMQRAQEENNKR